METEYEQKVTLILEDQDIIRMLDELYVIQRVYNHTRVSEDREFHEEYPLVGLLKKRLHDYTDLQG